LHECDRVLIKISSAQRNETKWAIFAVSKISIT
jgi:hypothetical protein